MTQSPGAHTYKIVTRGKIWADLDEFAAVVAATYADQRGWVRGGHQFVHRDEPAATDFTVVLCQAKFMTSFSTGCSPAWSCRVGRYVVINQNRWLHGSIFFPGPLAQYRRMVINHETGHWLGLGHAYCPSPGERGPVMQQMSKGMQGCRPNAWPLPREIEAVSGS